jgi:hypothetical protein
MSLPDELYSVLTTPAAADHESAKLLEQCAEVKDGFCETE